MYRTLLSSLGQLLCLLVLVGHSQSAGGAECSRIFEEHNDELSFGTRRLGGTPEWIRIRERAALTSICTYDEEKLYADCEYSDADGVLNLVEGNTIIRQVIRDFEAYRGKSVASVSRDDRLIDVVRKFSKFGPEFPVWVLAPVDQNSLAMTTGLCLRNGHGEVWALTFLFDENHTIKSMTAALEW